MARSPQDAETFRPKQAGNLAVTDVSALLNGVPLPLILVGQDERIVALNPRAEKLLGRNMVGRHFLTVLRHPDVTDAIAGTFQDARPHHARFVHKDLATETVYRVTCTPIESTPVSAVLTSLEDVTSIETASQMRRDFVANVSHELRTPLTALVGFIETLRGPARDDAAARDRFLEIMAREAERMNRLVDDLLSLSRVESEERVRPTELQSLPDIVDSVCLSLRPLAEAAGVVFDIGAAPDLPQVRGDADQLRQVFTNLIENAIKYGGAGGVIHIQYELVARDPNLGSAAVAVTVADEGPGIDTIHLHRLTERFYRADDHRAQSAGGTGLGLAIVKHIMNRHRGHLKIDSTPGKGSRFRISLPVRGK
ncbi:cell wall metabolism sensor histidine kinase WalK [Meridianimarinicoccus sp. MJW13]|uniref:sensor histidine kinase n=1 Tax=Meridianimarinicoccus sp. MJW13 TaxID=2720031 RepID=UPI001865CFB2|nr:ATP-binding protein [Fluviibacterium sp. MJW13]